VLDDIEDELSELGSVNAKVTRLLASVNALNNGNTDEVDNNNVGERVGKRYVVVEDMEESGAGKNGNWVNGLF